MSDVQPSDTAIEQARHLRLIARDLRNSGHDLPLVELSEEGVSMAGITLSDELWLVALQLDPEHAYDDMQGPDDPPGGR